MTSIQNCLIFTRRYALVTIIILLAADRCLQHNFQSLVVDQSLHVVVFPQSRVRQLSDPLHLRGFDFKLLAADAQQSWVREFPSGNFYLDKIRIIWAGNSNFQNQLLNDIKIDNIGHAEAFMIIEFNFTEPHKKSRWLTVVLSRQSCRRHWGKIRVSCTKFRAYVNSTVYRWISDVIGNEFQLRIVLFWNDISRFA